MVRERDIRDYKEQDRLAVLLEQPSDPASTVAFPCSCSVLCGIEHERLCEVAFGCVWYGSLGVVVAGHRWFLRSKFRTVQADVLGITAYRPQPCRTCYPHCEMQNECNYDTIAYWRYSWDTERYADEWNAYRLCR